MEHIEPSIESALISVVDANEAMANKAIVTNRMNICIATRALMMEVHDALRWGGRIDEPLRQKIQTVMDKAKSLLTVQSGHRYENYTKAAQGYNVRMFEI